MESGRKASGQPAAMFMRMAIIDIINSSKIDVGCESGAGQSSRFVTAAARGRFQAVRGRLVYVVVRVRAVAGSDGAERVCAKCDFPARLERAKTSGNCKSELG